MFTQHLVAQLAQFVPSFIGSNLAQACHAAGALVTGTKRALASLVPEDLRDEIPADW